MLCAVTLPCRLKDGWGRTHMEAGRGVCFSDCLKGWTMCLEELEWQREKRAWECTVCASMRARLRGRAHVEHPGANMQVHSHAHLHILAPGRLNAVSNGIHRSANELAQLQQLHMYVIVRQQVHTQRRDQRIHCWWVPHHLIPCG